MGCCGSKSKQATRSDTEPLNSTPATDGPAILKNLPAGAESFRCHHVYDGDTLTLQDRRRVRFLGIDTPELKEKKAFAKEAKQFTDAYCGKREIWLVFGPEAEDRYGRLLATVYAAHADGGYVCVNEGLVHEGLATYYSVGSELPNSATLLRLQSGARRRRVGVWSAFEDADVVATANGRCFHSRSCQHVSRVHRLQQLKKSIAIDKGLSSCRDCHA